RDDIVETLFLNVCFNGTLKAMPPKLISDDGRHTVIRPLAYVPEAELARYAAIRQFPIIPCDLCGSQENLMRKQVKALVQDWERRFPGCADNMLAALTNVVPSHLMDRRLHPFSTLRPTGQADPHGDTAFDEVPAHRASGHDSPVRLTFPG
ncbi:MAG: tRNA 2-thiocytidine(32) synthetase TtcA, partial [bacterium]